MTRTLIAALRLARHTYRQRAEDAALSGHYLVSRTWAQVADEIDDFLHFIHTHRRHQ
jgi:hypothetical protein